MFKMLKWARDDEGRIVVLINGKRYENKDAHALAEELNRVLQYDREREPCHRAGHYNSRG